MARWVKSKHPGIRYREHDTRRHGVPPKPDRYYTIFYKLDGKMVEEAVGWASQGMTEKKAAAMLAELQENHRRGTVPRTLKEKRELAAIERQEKDEQDRQTAMDNTTFSIIFYDKFIPHIKANRRDLKAWKRDEGLFRLWIAPVVGSKPLKDVSSFDLEKIKKTMTKAGKAARTIVYALGVVRLVFNYALAHDLYTGKNPAGPAGKVKRPITDNSRTRYLSREEAKALLKELAGRSRDVHDMALLSLYTGMRAGEIFSLIWADVDLAGGVIMLRKTKGNKNRAAFMTETVKAMMQAREKKSPTDLVFPGRNGVRIVQISGSFDRVVEKLGLNEGVADREQRVVFHTLRHTFASWLVETGADIYYVQNLMGHSDLKLTARYAHLGDNSLRAAVQRLENAEPPASVILMVESR
jgi:integrase